MSGAVQDVSTIDLEDFRHGETNITALRLIDYDTAVVKRVLSDWGFNPEHVGSVIAMGDINETAIHDFNFVPSAFDAIPAAFSGTRSFVAAKLMVSTRSVE